MPARPDRPHLIADSRTDPEQSSRRRPAAGRASVGIYSPYLVASIAVTTVDPDTRSLRSLMGDDCPGTLRPLTRTRDRHQRAYVIFSASAANSNWSVVSLLFRGSAKRRRKVMLVAPA